MNEKLNKWLETNTFDTNVYQNLKELKRLKDEKNLSVSVVIPTLEEESTIENVLKVTSTLLDILVDEILVIDGGSTDLTVSICKRFEQVTVLNQSSILPQYDFKGKGEALWKGLHSSNCDIIVYIDSDIKNFDIRFITGILAPMLLNDEIKFVKGFYKRPFVTSSLNASNEGGRVTELCARPLLNLLYPDLAGFIQPLGGEYGGYKNVLRELSYTSGYGVEVQILIEMFTI